VDNPNNGRNATTARRGTSQFLLLFPMIHL